MLFQWSFTALAITALTLPLGAENIGKRLELPGSTRVTKKVSEDNRRQILNLQRMNMRARLGSQSLIAPGGQMEFSIRPAAPEGPVNYLQTRSASDPRGKAYALLPNHNMSGAYADARLGTVDFATGKFESIYRGEEYSLGEDYNYLTTCIVDGIVYIPAYYQNMVTGEIRSYWRRIDLATGQQLSNINWGEDATGFFYALTYNPTTKKFYGLGLNLATGADSEFWEIDINGNPKKDYLGNLVTAREPGTACSLCYNPVDGELYTIKDNGKMYVVPAELSPKLLEVKEFSRNTNTYEYKCIPDERMPAVLTYSPRDRAFVTVYPNSTMRSMDLVFIDADDFEVYEGNSISQLGWYASLDCIEAYAEDYAPAQAAIDEIALDKNSLSGEIKFTASKEVYDGSAINSQELIMHSYLDGEPLDSRVCTPGQQVSVPFTTTQGNHTFTIVPEFKLGNGNLVKGPESRVIRWVGNDNPMPPTNVKLDRGKITWTAVGGLGAHSGYVDTDAVTYDVYFAKVKQNSTPIQGCEYEFEVPAELARRDIYVTASANGMVSEPSTPIVEVLGQAMSLPVHFVPTAEEAKLFTTNTGRSNYDFKFMDGANPCMGLEVTQYTDVPDNWLFLPKMRFDSSDHLYQMAFDYSNFYLGAERNESNVKVYIGKENNPKAMTELIIERESANVPSPIAIDALFAVPEPGEYYIGIYTGEARYMNSRGVRFSNFNVTSLENVSVNSPGAAEDVKLTPCPNGELAVVIDCVIPTKAINGQPLENYSDDITIKASSPTGGSAETSGKPGDKVSLKVPANNDGFNFFDVVTYVGETRTVKRTYRAYLGIDVPLAPQNIKGIASADNKSLHLTWDPVTTGENGGWVNPATVKYTINLLSGVNLEKVGETRECSYDFVPYSTTGKQVAYYVGPVAVTEMGSSVRSTFAYEFLGNPFEVPMIEPFTPTGPASFGTSPWNYKATDGYDNCPFSHVSTMVGLEIGDPVLDGGAFVCNALSGIGGWGELRAPKATTSGIHAARIGLRYWDYYQAADMYIYGRRHGHEDEELLFTITPSRPSELGDSRWIDWSEELPAEYQDCPWIQLYVRTHLQGANSYCVLDTYQIYQDVDHDFRISDITGPKSAWTGEKVTFSIGINNSGLEANRTNVILRFFGDGTDMLDRLDVPVRRLSPGATFNFIYNLEMKPEYSKYDNLTLVATVSDEDDEVSINNERSFSLTITDNQLPMIKEMSGSWNDSHDAATVTWTEPSLDYGDLESFEYDTPFEFTDKIGVWKNVDMDGKSPFGIEGATWNDYDKPCGWMVFDPVIVNMKGAERYTPASGKNCLIARSCSFYEGVEEPIQSADWLISPEIVGGTDVTFMYGTGDSSYKETVEVWYSTTTDELGDKIVQEGSNYTCGNWKRLRAFTKSGVDMWEECKFTLPKDAKYFAFVYRSWGQFNALLDDISYTPAKLSKWELVGYDVYREGRSGDIQGTYENVAWHTPLTSIVDDKVGDNNASYFVHTVVRRPDGNQFTSPRGTELRMNSQGLDDIKALQGISGGYGEIIASGLEGKTLSVYTADGKHLLQVDVTGSSQSIGINAGVYIVKSGNQIAKVVVK